MADACGIQKAYLWRTLNGYAHLSSDQLYLALQFLGFDDDERRYLELLHEQERSQIEKRKQQLGRRLERLRERHQRTEKYLNVRRVDVLAPERITYYLDPRLQIVHMLATLSNFSSNHTGLIEAVASSVGLSSFKSQTLLKSLENIGILRFEGKGVKVLEDHLHLPATSPLHMTYQTALRALASERLRRLRGAAQGSVRPYNTGAFFSADENTRRAIQHAFLSFLKDVEKKVRACREPDSVYQMNFDLIPW